MEHMNNHFGQSRIFGRAKLPMDLQFFSDAGAGETSGDPEDGTEDTNNGGNSDDAQTPTVEELLTQLAAERAKSAKLQNEKNAASSEAANFKKQLRAKMTSDEQAEQAKAEAEAEKDARIQELESKFQEMDYSKRYMGVGMDEKTATELAGLTGEIAESDKFFSALKVAIKKVVEDSVADIIKNNPSVKAGNGEGDKESEAVRLARESAARRQNKGFNEDALKQWT